MKRSLLPPAHFHGCSSQCEMSTCKKNAVSSLLPGTGGIRSTCLGEHFTLLRVKKITLPSKGCKIQWHEETASLMHTLKSMCVLPLCALQQLIFSSSCKFKSVLSLVK